MEEVDHYSLLGLGRKSSGEEIKRAFRRKAHQTHPDKGGTDQEFKRVNEAFEVLSDPVKRAEYDKILVPPVHLALLDSEFAEVERGLGPQELEWIEDNLRGQLVSIRDQIRNSPTGVALVHILDREACCTIGVKVAEEPDHSIVYQPVSVVPNPDN